MSTPKPAPARARPALKLYSTVAPVDAVIAHTLDVPRGTHAAVYTVAVNRVAAMDALTRVDSLYAFHTGRDVEAHPFGGGPEIAQAIARDDRAAMVEGAVFVVHGTTVLALDDHGFPTTAGRYAHDRRRYLPATAADRLAEMIERVEAILRRGHGLVERDEVALREVIDAAMVRQVELREAERRRATVAAAGVVDPPCADDNG